MILFFFFFLTKAMASDEESSFYEKTHSSQKIEKSADKENNDSDNLLKLNEYGFPKVFRVPPGYPLHHKKK